MRNITQALIAVIAALMLLPALSRQALAQMPGKKEFSIISDSLTAKVQRRMGGDWKVSIKNFRRNGDKLDLIFTDDIMAWPWREGDLEWFREETDRQIEAAGYAFGAGNLTCKGIALDELITPGPGNNGRPKGGYRYAMEDPRKAGSWPFVRQEGAKRYDKGLTDRYIALWQSHGSVYSPTDSCWTWQRARLHRTVEDMYTQSYVLPFLIPMLENSGAYVMTPRERDTQKLEVVCDNDPAWEGERGPLERRAGKYSETGQWSDGGTGFADARRYYSSTANPFRMGSARRCQSTASRNAGATARWTPDFAERGSYAVYVSYRSFPNSVTDAHYTVHHLGGKSQFRVNQRRGGGTWIYLGTFEFGSGESFYVELDNRSSKAGGTVSADAVRFGGGMGKVMREGTVSGLPAYCEGALYSMIWAGVDSTLYCEWERDYTRDFASRGRWCKMLRDELDIPLDLSLAFHTDAGTTPNDSLVGTLAIYTLKSEGSRKMRGGDRMCSRMLADMVQSQIVQDLRASYDPQWTRRMLWDKSYSECRTNDMPAMILELLSHQNFSDMKYGLDPAFRFSVCRSVYKGVVKFLSELYGCRYAIQPLPVEQFAARLEDGRAMLSWSPREDPSEPTATSEGYFVYVRRDDGAFDAGREVKDCKFEMDLEPGHIYSFKVEAFNSGGKSFPSQILSVGIAPQSKGEALIVNNFDRVSAPAWMEGPGIAGFYSRLDGGVPYVNDISYIGENYEFRRSLRWESDLNPGCGASWDDCAGRIIAGNSFDYPAVHGRSLMRLGYSFQSMSSDAFCADTAQICGSGRILDLICGKQALTVQGNGRVAARFKLFTPELREAIRAWTASGGNMIISGSNIGTDPWVNCCNEDDAEQQKQFVSEVLGYKHSSSFGSYVGEVRPAGRNVKISYPFYNSPGEQCYCVECPDAIEPASRKGKVWLRYVGTGAPAAVFHDAGGYRVCAVGIPLEILKNEADRDSIFEYSLGLFAK